MGVVEQDVQAIDTASAYIAPFLKRYRIIFQIDLGLCLLHFLLAVLLVILVIRSPQNFVFPSVLFLIHIAIGATGALADIKLLKHNLAAAWLAYLNACISVLGRILGIIVVIQFMAADFDWPVLESLVDPELMSTVSFVLAPIAFYNLLYAMCVFQFVKWSRIISQDGPSILENA